jgi:hypothetical protein
MSHQRLPDGIENQLAAMQQSRLHPHDWRVLERLIREALADQYASLRAQVQALQQERGAVTARLNEVVSQFGVVYYCDPTEDGSPAGWRNVRAEKAEQRTEAAAAEIAQLLRRVEELEKQQKA